MKLRNRFYSIDSLAQEIYFRKRMLKHLERALTDSMPQAALRMGMDVESIAKLTGVSSLEIRKLRH